MDLSRRTIYRAGTPVLHRIVSLYIEYAEFQALERKPMTMLDWITKIDELLKVSGRVVLDYPLVS